MIRLLSRGAGPVRFLLLSLGAALISLAVFALVPLLLRQTSYQPDFVRDSYALLIPLQPAPRPVQPEPDMQPLPEEPEPPEPEIEARTPDIPEIDPPELEPPEVTREPLDLSPMQPPALEPASPDLEQPRVPSLQTISVSAMPLQSSPMNLKVHLKVGKVPAPGAARPAFPAKPGTGQMRFGLHEVDQKPVSIAALKPHYPYRARRMGIEGYVTVRFLVDREGKAQEVTIMDSEPEGVFEQSVRKTVPRWRFKPGKKAGRPVDTWVEMTIRFGMEDDG
ncbi:MAG: TonB family protein [Desulfobacteraceae bacterium]